jgi:hypothetical protein
MLGAREFDPTPAQARVLGAYRSGAQGARSEAMVSLRCEERTAWQQRANEYFADPRFETQVLRTLL